MDYDPSLEDTESIASQTASEILQIELTKVKY